MNPRPLEERLAWWASREKVSFLPELTEGVDQTLRVLTSPIALGTLKKMHIFLSTLGSKRKDDLEKHKVRSVTEEQKPFLNYKKAFYFRFVV